MSTQDVLVSAAPAASRRLLVISYHFPPDGAVGGLRWAGLSKYLARVGWEVHIVTAAAGPGVAAPGVHRHRCRDTGRGWARHAARTVTTLLRNQSFDAVITSGPPHSAHFAGIVATARTGIPHVIDMREPWRYGELRQPGHAIASWAARPLQRLVFALRRQVVVTSRECAELLHVAFPRLSVTLVSNGTDAEMLPVRSDLFEETSIACAGATEANEDFGAVLDALESLRRERSDAAARLRLRVAGQMSSAQRQRLRTELTRRGIADMVHLCGALRRDETLALLRRSHLALVLAGHQPTQIPAMLYESVGLGVPTLVLSKPTDAANREARRIGGIVIEPDDSVGLRHLLDELVDGHVPLTMAPTAPISYDSLAGQMDALLQLAAAPGS